MTFHSGVYCAPKLCSLVKFNLGINNIHGKITQFWLVTKVLNQTFWLVNNRRNPQIANRMWALNVGTKFEYLKICERWPAFYVGFLSPPPLKNSSNNENTVKSTAFWLSVWKKWCLEKGISKEIKNYEPTQLNTLLKRSNTEIKNKHD